MNNRFGPETQRNWGIVEAVALRLTRGKREQKGEVLEGNEPKGKQTDIASRESRFRSLQCRLEEFELVR
jgi:hypothetical protein